MTPARTLTFPDTYFSGADVAVYWGDQWVDDVVALSFSVHEQLQPVYGYGSFTFDAVLRGTRLVEGAFRINFRQAGYLHTVASQASLKEDTVAQVLAEQRAVSAFRYELDPYMTEGELADLLRDASPQARAQIARQLQEQAWEQPQASAEALGLTPAPRMPGGFSLTILYGLPPPPGVGWQLGAGELPAGTMLRVEGVYLGSATQVTEGSGTPVYEDYTFIARDVSLPVEVRS